MYDIQQGEAAGIRYLERKGKGTPLVLLHGIGSNASSFSELMSALPDNLRVIAWHAPGYSGSTPLETEWPRAVDYADKLSVVLQALNMSAVDVVEPIH